MRGWQTEHTQGGRAVPTWEQADLQQEACHPFLKK